MTTVSQPNLDQRPEQPYMGIRTQTPMKGMSKTVGKLFEEIGVWAKQHNLRPAGPPFLRYHVIDMAGEMDIELGIPVETPLPGDGRVSAGSCRPGASPAWCIPAAGTLATKRYSNGPGPMATPGTAGTTRKAMGFAAGTNLT